MPRQPRLDAFGVLQHVMARGIERCRIFRDDNDRKNFLARLAKILYETNTQCYAWALIPNHFHLLLRTGHAPLSLVMRRLMTGYAVSFNRRHHRAGHLFQNRYKSVVCEENAYLLELIRYIHLNPLRAKLVSDMDALNVYPWAGHSVLMGYCKNPLMPEINAAHCPNKPEQPDNPCLMLAEKTIDDVLRHFTDTLDESRINYRNFVEKGIVLGRRTEFQGGGLIRSMGGKKSDTAEIRRGNIELSDPRILGSGHFVGLTLKETEKILEKKYLPKRSIEKLIEVVADQTGISPELICSGSRKRKYCDARAVVSWLAVEESGHSAEEVGKYIGIGPSNILRSIKKGREIGIKYIKQKV